MTTIVKDANLQNFIAVLNTKNTVISRGYLKEYTIAVDSELLRAVIGSIDEAGFLEAASEAGENGELSYGYSVLNVSSEYFFESNKTQILKLIESMAKNYNESMSSFVISCVCDTAYPLVKSKHTDMIINSTKHFSSVDLTTEAMSDAYEIVTYQLCAHAIMTACAAFNHYVECLESTNKAA